MLVYDDIEIRDVSWKYDDMDITRRGDSITVKKGNAYITGFRLDNRHIVDTRYIVYYPDGTIKQIDSLFSGSRWNSKRYWGEYFGNVIHRRKYNVSGILEEMTHYTGSGKDSLTQKWYPAGTLHQSIWGDREWGTDSATHTWDEEGILASIETRKFRKEFYPTGSLKNLFTDTVTGGRSIRCHKAYYPTGPLLSIAYYCEETPCLTWLYYTEKGKLYKTVQQASLSSIPPSDLVLYDPPYSIPGGKETNPEFQGSKSLYKYLNEKLAEVACSSPLAIAGGYQIEFTVGVDGGAVFENISGENHGAIVEIVKQTIEQMPKWKPGTKDDKPVKTGCIIKLYVKNIK